MHCTKQQERQDWEIFRKANLLRDFAERTHSCSVQADAPEGERQRCADIGDSFTIVFGEFNGGILEIPDLPHQVGDKVTIIAGLFKGASGKVTRLVSARERVKVLFEFLGRETEAEIDEDSLDFPKAHPMGAG